MEYYKNGKFKKENSMGFSSVTKEIIMLYIDKFDEHLKNLKKCIKEITFDHPICETHLAGLKQSQIADFFELNHRQGNSKKGVFYIANFDKLLKNIFINNRKINNALEINESDYQSYNDEEDEESEKFNQKNKKNKKNLKK